MRYRNCIDRTALRRVQNSSPPINLYLPDAVTLLIACRADSLTSDVMMLEQIEHSSCGLMDKAPPS